MNHTSGDILDSGERARRAAEDQRLLNIYIDSPMDQYAQHESGNGEIAKANE